MGQTYGKPIELVVPNREQWVLGRILETRARTHADRPYLQWEDSPALTFAEVNREVNRVAHGLQAAGVRAGDRVALLLPNCLELVFAWFALNKIGAVEVPVNIHYRGQFLEHALNVVRARFAITDAEFLPALADVEPALGHLETLFVRRQPEAPQRFAKLRVRDYRELCSADSTDPCVEVGYRDIAAILFTSGTTGPSKGVLMPHAQLCFFSLQCVDLVQLTDADTYMNPFPLFHGNAQFLTVYPALLAGARAVLYERFSASTWIDRVRASGATVTNFLGATMDYVFKQPERTDDAAHQLRLIYAVPTPHGILPAWRQRFGEQVFVTSFGQTETSWPLMGPQGEAFPAGAVGKVVDDWFEVKLVDPETDEEVAPGEMGELVVRPKAPWIVCEGYSENPAATAQARRNLWWHTGDGLRRDAAGWYYFIDRTNDAMRVRGENVSSFEVEQVVLEHPAVAECAAVAVRSELAGGEHEIKVVVVLQPGARLEPEALIRHCERRAPWFAVPRYVEVVDELPKTPNEKIRKVLLRQRGLTPTTWDRVAAGVELQQRRGARGAPQRQEAR